ncbi:MAG: AbrB family transcriptional regulator [Thalassobaculales bacterium]
MSAVTPAPSPPGGLAALGRPLQWLALAALSVVVSRLLDWSGIPSALLIGSMAVGVGFGLAGGTVRVPRRAFFFAQGLIGCQIARALSPGLLAELAGDWPLLLGLVTLTLTFSAFAGWVAARSRHLPGDAAAWGSLPGMAGAIVAVSQNYGADTRIVALMQYLRVAAVVVVATAVTHALAEGAATPAAALAAGPAATGVAGNLSAGMLATLAIAAIGPLVGGWRFLPAGPLVVPMLVAAALHGAAALAPPAPGWMMWLAYGLIGVHVGLRFTRASILHVLRAMPPALLSTALTIALSGLLALCLVRFLGFDPLTAFLATVPGSIETVAVIALGSDVDMGLVVAVQTVRLFAVVLAGPSLARLIVHLGNRG